MSWLWYSLAAVAAFTGQNLLMRVLAVKSDHPRLFSFAFDTWGVFFALIVFFLTREGAHIIFQLSWQQYLLIAAAGVLYGFYERFQFFARKGVDASSLATFFRVSPAIAFIGSLIFLREAITATKILGASLTIGASFLLVYKNPKIRSSSALRYASLCVLFLGVAWILDKPASVSIQPSLYSFIMWAFPLGIIAFPTLPKKELLKEFKIGGWRLALTAFLNVVGYIWNLQALALADASRVIPVVSTTGITVVLGGIIFLGEHDHMRRKIVAAALAFVGVLLLR